MGGGVRGDSEHVSTARGMVDMSDMGLWTSIGRLASDNLPGTGV